MIFLPLSVLFFLFLLSLTKNLPILQNQSVDELADMPSCNLSETIHNKWLQASGKRGTDLYVATCDDWVRAFMQMTNYWVYLRGGLGASGPSHQDLKLKRVVASMDSKRIHDALCSMPGAEEVCTRIPHLEGEEVFGSMKRKADVSIGSEGDSHRPNKVNFSHPRVQLTSTIGSPTTVMPDGLPN